MKKKLILLTFSILFMIGILSLSLYRVNASSNMTEAIWTDSSPLIDGVLDQAYSQNGPQISFYYDPPTKLKASWNYIYILNDNEYIYIFIDFLSDNETYKDDALYLWLDTNNSNQLYTSQINPDFSLWHDRDDYCINFTTPSSLDYSLIYRFGNSPNGAYNHVQWELKLTMNNMSNNVSSGDTIGYLFAFYDNFVSFVYYAPNSYTGIGGPIWEADERSYNDLVLASEPSSPPTNPPLFDLTLPIFVGVLIGSIIISFVAGMGVTIFIRRVKPSSSKRLKF